MDQKIVKQHLNKLNKALYKKEQELKKLFAQQERIAKTNDICPACVGSQFIMGNPCPRCHGTGKYVAGR